MAKKRSPSNQLEPKAKAQLPEYGQLVSILQTETASILTDYVRQYIGIAGANEPGSGIFLNWDRVLRTQGYQELAWYDLYQEVERDAQVAAALSNAKLNIAGMKYSIAPHLEAGEETASARNEAIADFVQHAIKRIKYFPQDLFNLLGAIGMGFAVSEIIWEITDEGVMPKELLNRPQRRFQFDAADRSLRLRDIKNPYWGTPLPDKKFIVHRASAMWDNPFGDALDQTLYWMWLFKRTVTKFWMQHLQVGASSIPIVKHPMSASPTLKAEALAIAEMIRNGAYGRIPDNFEIQFAEAKNAIQNAEAYEKFINFCDEQIAKCVNGQSLTTQSGSSGGAGTHALGKVHQGTQQARDEFRAHGLEATLNATLIKWLVDFNFADVDGYPEFRFDMEQETDLKMEADIVKILSDAGFKFDVDELSEKFNYTLTKKEPPPQLAPFAGQQPVNNPVDDTDAVKDNPMKTKTFAKLLDAMKDIIVTEEHENKQFAQKTQTEQEERESRWRKEFTTLVETISNKDVVVNVPAPVVNVESPKAPIVHIAPARVEFRQQPPQIVVNVPKQEPPVVNVTVEKSGIDEIEFQRDGFGFIKKLIGKKKL